MMTRAALLLAISLPCTSVAHAGVLFLAGNDPQPGQENVLLNNGQTGTTVFGETQSGIDVAFSSITDILTAPSNGQARVEAVDALVNNITVSIPDGFFTSLVMNPFTGS